MFHIQQLRDQEFDSYYNADIKVMVFCPICACWMHLPGSCRHSEYKNCKYLSAVLKLIWIKFQQLISSYDPILILLRGIALLKQLLSDLLCFFDIE